MSDRDSLDDSLPAYSEDFKFTDENIGMLQAYSRRMCDRLVDRGPLSLLGLGIGHQVVIEGFLANLADVLERYVVVEGSPAIIESFRRRLSPDSKLEIIEGWFEEYEPEQPVDVIEMGFVLEHVDDPRLIVDRYRRFLKPGGTLFMAVPNARSLHRIIGHDAGLLDDVYTLSEHDLALGHQRYYDRASFVRLVEECGLEIVSVEGLFLKPLTTGQLASLNLPPEVWHALYHGGKPFPELCNAIFIEATVS